MNLIKCLNSQFYGGFVDYLLNSFSSSSSSCTLQLFTTQTLCPLTAYYVLPVGGCWVSLGNDHHTRDSRCLSTGNSYTVTVSL